MQLIVPTLLFISLLQPLPAQEGEITAEEANGLTDTELISMLTDDPKLLAQPALMAEFEERARSNVALLNDNPAIKRQWFSQYGITSAGAQIAALGNNMLFLQGGKTAFA